MDEENIYSYLDDLQRNAIQNRTFQSNGVLFNDSPAGTAYSLPADLYEPGLNDFLVNVNGNGTEWTVNVAKGTVLYRSSPNVFNGGCLQQYLVQGFAVYPKDSRTEGDYNETPWVDKGGYCTISPLTTTGEGEEAVTTGSNQYGVYLIANQYKLIGSPGIQSATPYLALMPVNGDAETKTRPWGNEGGCDLQRWFEFYQYKNVALLQPPIDPTYEVSGQLTISRESVLQNYNCQRIRLALITWDTTALVWSVTQYAAGTITIPYNIWYNGIYSYPVEDPPAPYPDWYGSPLYGPEQEDWEGDYTDCDKWDGTGINPTVPL
jgi:hypothetical protein